MILKYPLVAHHRLPHLTVLDAICIIRASSYVRDDFHMYASLNYITSYSTRIDLSNVSLLFCMSCFPPVGYSNDRSPTLHSALP